MPHRPRCIGALRVGNGFTLSEAELFCIAARIEWKVVAPSGRVDLAGVSLVLKELAKVWDQWQIGKQR